MFGYIDRHGRADAHPILRNHGDADDPFAESIELFRDLGCKFHARVGNRQRRDPMTGFQPGDYAQKMVDEYRPPGPARTSGYNRSTFG